MKNSVQGRAVEPRVVLVGPTPPPWGGVSVHIKRVSAHMDEANIPHWILSTTAMEESGSIISLGTSKVFALLRNLRSLGGRTVVVHSSELHGLLVAVLCSFSGAHVAQHFHNCRALTVASRSWLRRGLVRLLLGRLDRAYAVNGVIAETLGAIQPKLKVVELHAFVPPSTEELSQASVALDLPVGVFAVGWCGIVAGERAEIYGFDFFLEVLEILRLKGWPVVGVIGASDGSSLDRVRPSIQDCVSRLRHALVFVPELDPFVAYMPALSVFVRPTTTDGDALSIREAISLGVPVVASSVVSRPGSCRTFPLGDRESCANLVIDIFSNSRREAKQRIVREIVDVTGVGDLEFGFDEFEVFLRDLQTM